MDGADSTSQAGITSTCITQVYFITCVLQSQLNSICSGLRRQKRRGFWELRLSPVTQSLCERKSERVIPAQGEDDHGMRFRGPKKAGRGHDGSDDRGLRRRS